MSKQSTIGDEPIDKILEEFAEFCSEPGYDIDRHNKAKAAINTLIVEARIDEVELAIEDYKEVPHPIFRQDLDARLATLKASQKGKA